MTSIEDNNMMKSRLRLGKEQRAVAKPKYYTARMMVVHMAPKKTDRRIDRSAQSRCKRMV